VLQFALSMLAALRVFFRSRGDTALEVLALRQQVAVLKRKHPRAPLNSLDRLFWTTLRHVWSRWRDVLVVVKPETVVGWHRAGFRLYWRWRSRPRGGRPKITEEIRALIRRMVEENEGWGAPKIHGELLKLGFVVSERTVARYLRRVRRRGDSGKRWLTFLRNHREVIVAFDFFTVPTLTFQLLYCCTNEPTPRPVTTPAVTKRHFAPRMRIWLHTTELPRLVTSEAYLLAFAGGSGFAARIRARMR